MEPPGWCSDWLAPPPSPPRAQAPGRHDERGVGTSNWPPAGTYTWPSARTFPWPRTGGLINQYEDGAWNRWSGSVTGFWNPTGELVFRSSWRCRRSVGRGDTPGTRASWILGCEE